MCEMSDAPSTGAREPVPGVAHAELVLPCDGAECFAQSLSWFVDTLGFRVAAISPADAPTGATLVAYGTRLRLERLDGAGTCGSTLRLLVDSSSALGPPGRVFLAPNGVRVLLVDSDAPIVTPAAPPGGSALIVTRAPRDGGWSAGRAGLLYRDLLPGRLGGRLIASHIRIEHGGPVADYVHYHKVAFQIIVVVRGTVHVVYEDCGPPFTMRAGDAVLQPPRIRHRVLAASDALEVVELAVPAVHETEADAALPLPNTRAPVAGREWSGQRFTRHVAAGALWTIPEGGVAARPAAAVCDLGIAAATKGVASARSIRGAGLAQGSAPAAGATFVFITLGNATLRVGTDAAVALAAGDAAALPAGPWELELAADSGALEVTLCAL